MATENNHTPSFDNRILVGLSTVGGVGITLLMLALGFGVAGGENANSNLVGIAVLTGFFLLVFAIGAWFGYVQPHKHFDNIDEAADSGHHGHADPAHDAEHAAQH